jgi:hypothetical protein
MTMNGSIIEALTALGGNLKTAGRKSAADAPTSHPVGSADDGAIPAKEGEFAKTNLTDSKRTGGPLSVDNAEDGVHPTKKQKNLPQQQELNPTSADGPVPSEIKPKKTVESGDDDNDAGALGGQETGGGKGEGHVGGVGGPKFANAKVVSDMDEFLKLASAIIPQEEKPMGAAGNATPASQTSAPAGSKAAGAVEDGISQEEANDLLEQEKQASILIKHTLAKMNVPENASVATKRAALVQAVAAEGEKAANGWLASMDERVLTAITTGNLDVLGLKKADDAGAALPPSVPSGDAGAAAGGEAPPAGAEGAAPPAGGEGGGDVEQVIQQVLAAVQAGEIPAEEALGLLKEMGVPDEIIAQIAQQLGGAGGAAAGGEGAAPAGDPAAAGGAPVASPESGTTV